MWSSFGECWAMFYLFRRPESAEIGPTSTNIGPSLTDFGQTWLGIDETWTSFDQIWTEIDQLRPILAQSRLALTQPIWTELDQTRLDCDPMFGHPGRWNDDHLGTLIEQRRVSVA